MKCENIKAESYITAFDDCVKRVNGRKKSMEVRTVVIVPDKYTLYAERRLFAGGGAFDVEVVTFNRLLQKLGCRPEGYISRFGAVMLLRKLIGDGKDLKCFHRSAQFTGFADKLYDTIAQLDASAVTPDMLKKCNPSDSALKAKTDDLITLHERYLQAVKNKYVDSSALLALLPEAVKNSDYLKGAIVYILNFDRFTARHRAVIDAISECAEYVGIYEVDLKRDTKLKKSSEIQIYSAPDSETELKAAAARIRNDVYEKGYKYGDFCIVTALNDYTLVNRVFSDYGIPFGMDYKYPLSNYPAARYLLAALDAADGRLSRMKLVRFAKNVLTGISHFDASVFENYCNGRRIDYKGFLSEFEDEVAEKVRARVLTLLKPLRSNLKPYMSACDFSAVLTQTLSLAGGTDELPTADEAHDLKSFASKLDEIIMLMSEIMGDGVFPLTLLVATFKEGIESRELTLLPALSDSVAIGRPDSFRGQKFKRIFVLGFNEGVLPQIMQDCGIITDGEIDKLQTVGAKIEPRTEDVNIRARSELLHLLGGCDRLFLSYVNADMGVSCASAVALIKRDNPWFVTESYERERELLDNDFLPIRLERTACCESAAAELFLSEMNGIRRPEYLSTLALALKERTNVLLNNETDDFILKPNRNIFFRKKTAYISQIQTFFACPHRHFLEYGLGLKEREDGSIAPKDVGIILHKVAEVFVREGKFDSPRERSAKIFRSLLDDEMKSFADIPESDLKRLEEESGRLCVTISAQMKKSRYESIGQEVMFSARGKAEYSAPSITLKNGEKVFVVGVIDRLDKCGNKVRIIDYKSGGIDSLLKNNMLYYGIKFQLQFYAEVLRKSGFDIAGMFYFPIGNDWSDSEDYCRMKGVFDKDIECIKEMDTSLSDGGKSELFNVTLTLKKNGELSVGRNTLAYEREQLNAICEYAEKIFVSGVEDIDRGFIRAVPYVCGVKSACDYCPFKSVCMNGEVQPRVLGADKTEAVTGKAKGAKA